jgi:hypothetical protein
MPLPELIATELLRQLFTRVPNAERLIEAVRPGIAAAIRAALAVLKVDESKLADWIAQLIGWPGGSPSLGLALGAQVDSAGGKLDPTSRDQALAQFIGRLLSPLLSQAFWGEKDAKAPKPGPADSAESLEQLDKDIAELSRDVRFGPVKQVLEESGVLPLARDALHGGAMAAAAYEPEKVQAALRALVRAIARLVPDLGNMVDYVESEIGQSILRSGLAEAIGKALDALQFSVKSSTEIGSYVHEQLQASYLDRNRSSRLVLERWSTDTRRAELVCYLPAFGIEPLSLRVVAASRRYDPDLFFMTLRAAMNGFHLYNKASWLRADLVDADLEQIWEIKPTSSLFGGVWQETLYRVSHNIVRGLVLRGMPMQLRRQKGFLWPGEFWGLGGELVPEARQRGFLPFAPIQVSKKAGAPALAFPFQIEVLPGLIGYFVLRGPNIPQAQRVIEFIIAAAMGEALRAMLKALDEIDGGWGEAVKMARKLYEEVSRELPKIAEALYTLILVLACIVAVVLAGLIIVKLLAVAGSALIIGGAVAGATSILFIILAPPKESALGGNTAVGERLSPVTRLRIGPIQIDNVPTDKADALLAAIAQRFHDICGEFVKEMASSSRAQA